MPEKGGDDDVEGRLGHGGGAGRQEEVVNGPRETSGIDGVLADGGESGGDGDRTGKPDILDRPDVRGSTLHFDKGRDGSRATEPLVTSSGASSSTEPADPPAALPGRASSRSPNVSLGTARSPTVDEEKGAFLPLPR